MFLEIIGKCCILLSIAFQLMQNGSILQSRLQAEKIASTLNETKVTQNQEQIIAKLLEQNIVIVQSVENARRAIMEDEEPSPLHDHLKGMFDEINEFNNHLKTDAKKTSEQLSDIDEIKSDLDSLNDSVNLFFLVFFLMGSLMVIVARVIEISESTESVKVVMHEESN